MDDPFKCCDCLTESDEPGCPSNSACQLHVGIQDSYCITDAWDSICVNDAQGYCSDTTYSPTMDTTNPTMMPSMSPTKGPTDMFYGCCNCLDTEDDPGCAASEACTTQVAAIDVYCQDTKWNEFCVALAEFFCDGHEWDDTFSCCDCLVESTEPGCDDAPCNVHVGAQDDFCIESAWDGLCVSYAQDECDQTTGPTDGPTLEPTSEPTVDVVIVNESTEEGGSDAAEQSGSGSSGTSSVEEVLGQWWFWLMLVAGALVVLIVLIFRCTRREPPKVRLDTFDSTTMAGGAGAHSPSSVEMNASGAGLNMTADAGHVQAATSLDNEVYGGGNETAGQ